MRRACGASVFRVQRSPCTCTCLPTPEAPKPVPSGFYGGFITLAWLSKSLALGDWFSPQTFSPPQKPEGGTDSSSLLSVVGPAGNQPLVLRGFLKVTWFT